MGTKASSLSLFEQHDDVMEVKRWGEPLYIDVDFDCSKHPDEPWAGLVEKMDDRPGRDLDALWARQRWLAKFGTEEIYRYMVNRLSRLLTQRKLYETDEVFMRRNLAALQEADTARDILVQRDDMAHYERANAAYQQVATFLQIQLAVRDLHEVQAG